MKKLIGIAIAGSLFCAPAMAQQGTLDALLGPTGPIAGLQAIPEAGNLGPLVDGLASNSGLIRGDVAPPLNDTLSGLLVNQDPDQFATGLQTTVEVTVAALMRGLGGGAVAGGSGGGGSGAPGLPGLDALPGADGLPGLDALPALPGL